MKKKEIEKPKIITAEDGEGGVVLVEKKKYKPFKFSNRSDKEPTPI